MLALLIACATETTGGHLKEDELLSSVKIGATSKDEVAKLLGYPSSESSFGPSTWYYISTTHRNRSVFATKVVDQRVLEIAFNNAGTVASIKQYALADGKNVQIATDTTPTEGQKLGFFEQILGNLGRFNNNADNSASNSHTHGNPMPGYPSR